MFGLTKKEWWALNIGACVQGAVMGAVLHSLFVLGLNMVGLALYIYLYQNAEPKE